jgi:hypothetical protein
MGPFPCVRAPKRLGAPHERHRGARRDPPAQGDQQVGEGEETAEDDSRGDRTGILGLDADPLQKLVPLLLVGVEADHMGFEVPVERLYLGENLLVL